jgi:hypothetical protein
MRAAKRFHAETLTLASSTAKKMTGKAAVNQAVKNIQKKIEMKTMGAKKRSHAALKRCFGRPKCRGL